MSGYNVHELCLTPFHEQPSLVLERARAFMQTGYSMFEEPQWCALIDIEGPGTGEHSIGAHVDLDDTDLDEYIQMGGGVRILQNIKLLRAHYSMMLMMIPVGGYRCGFIWKIESSTFDRIQDWNDDAEWDESMKTAVAGWVFGLARACDADGFVLKRDYDELRVYTRERIHQKLTQTKYEIDDPLNGSALTGLSNVPLRQVHGGQKPDKTYYTVFGRYTVMDLMHRPEPDDD